MGFWVGKKYYCERCGVQLDRSNKEVKTNGIKDGTGPRGKGPRTGMGEGDCEEEVMKMNVSEIHKKLNKLELNIGELIVAFEDEVGLEVRFIRLDKVASSGQPTLLRTRVEVGN